MEAITTTRYANLRWNKGYVNFILYFLDLFRQYEDITDPREWMVDQMKLMFLQNAVASIPRLDNIKTQFRMAHETTGQVPDFGNYKQLLIAAATDLDNLANHNNNTRRANQHEIYFDDDTSDTAEPSDPTDSTDISIDPLSMK